MNSGGSENFFKKLEKMKGIKFIICGIVLGLTLIIIGSLMDKTHNSDEKTDDRKDVSGQICSENYASELERKLTALLNSSLGINDASVMITLDGGNEYVYARDIEGDGGAKKYVIIKKSGSEETAVLVKELMPKVNGAAIICGGGSNLSTQAEIIQLVTALFGISSNHVYVGGK